MHGCGDRRGSGATASASGGNAPAALVERASVSNNAAQTTDRTSQSSTLGRIAFLVDSYVFAERESCLAGVACSKTQVPTRGNLDSRRRDSRFGSPNYRTRGPSFLFTTSCGTTNPRFRKVEAVLESSPSALCVRRKSNRPGRDSNPRTLWGSRLSIGPCRRAEAPGQFGASDFFPRPLAHAERRLCPEICNPTDR